MLIDPLNLFNEYKNYFQLKLRTLIVKMKPEIKLVTRLEETVNKFLFATSISFCAEIIKIIIHKRELI